MGGKRKHSPTVVEPQQLKRHLPSNVKSHSDTKDRVNHLIACNNDRFDKYRVSVRLCIYGGKCCFGRMNRCREATKELLSTNIASCVSQCTTITTLGKMAIFSNDLATTILEHDGRAGSHLPDIKKGNAYLMPPLSNHDGENGTIILCESCFFTVIGGDTSKVSTIKYHMKNSLKSSTFKKVLKLAKKVIPNDIHTSNPVIVASRRYIEQQIDTVIELSGPSEQKKDQSSNAGGIYWSDIKIDGSSCSGFHTIDSNKTAVIIAPMSDMKQCNSNERTNPGFCYLEKVDDDEAVVVLAVYSPQVENNPQSFSYDLIPLLTKRVKYFKKNMLSSGQGGNTHYEANGLYYPFGASVNSAFGQSPDNTINISSTRQYRTYNLHASNDIIEYGRIVQSLQYLMTTACNRIEQVLPNAVQKSNKGQHRICRLVDAYNNLNEMLDTGAKDIHYCIMDTFYNTSYNYCIDASTGKAHCENDSTMTMIVPIQGQSGSFYIKVNSSTTLSFPLLAGSVLDLNALWLKHHQVLDCRGEQPFVNLASYSNRNLNDSVCKSLRRGTNVLICKTLQINMAIQDR